MSSHPELSLIFIFNHFDNMWYFNYLSERNILSFDFINPCTEYNFIWKYIFDNKIIDEKEFFIRNCYRAHFMKPYSIFENIVKKFLNHLNFILK